MTSLPARPLAHPPPPHPSKSIFDSPEYKRIIENLTRLGAGKAKVDLNFRCVSLSRRRSELMPSVTAHGMACAYIHLIVLGLLERVYRVSGCGVYGFTCQQ